MQIVILRQPMPSVWASLRMSHGHSHLYNALAVQWEKFVQRIIKLCTIIHTASMAHTTIWMLLFSEYCLLRSTTGNAFKFVRMFKSLDHFLAKNNIVFFNLLTNPMELNPYSETHLADQAVSHLLETWLCFFASPPPSLPFTRAHHWISSWTKWTSPYCPTLFL